MLAEALKGFEGGVSDDDGSLAELQGSCCAHASSPKHYSKAILLQKGNNCFDLLSFPYSQADDIALVVLPASDEVKRGEGESIGQVLDNAGALKPRGGVSMQIENEPLTFVLRLKDGKSYRFVLMANHQIFSLVLGLIEHEGARAYLK